VGPICVGDIVLLVFDADIKLAGGAPLLTLFEKWPAGQFAVSGFPRPRILQTPSPTYRGAANPSIGQVASPVNP
jgi:hypothetical protein